MIKDITLRVKPEIAAQPKLLKKVLARDLRIDADAISDFRVIKRSVDARNRNIWINLTVRILLRNQSNPGESLEEAVTPVNFPNVSNSKHTVLIVGAGPAGLFAALQAVILGMKPIIFERGKDVDSRRLDIAEISKSKKINPESNYCFGEGGAGAYSDGKLYTRSKKRGNVEDVLKLLVQFGASPDILVDAHPHIGSDKLPNVIKNIRNQIIKSGGIVYFEKKVDGLIVDNAGNAVGVKCGDEDYSGDGTVIAIGHSAHDTFRNFKKQNLKYEPKGIAVGVRLEHPQHLIDQIQYHNPAGRGKYLPAAEYSLVTQVDGRGVYSFCMCPGGVIVPAGSAEGELVVNGMSASARSGKWANSGMVVEIHPGDFPEYAKFDDLEMLYLQESLEKNFYHGANDSIVAPAQRMKDFTEDKVSDSLPPSSYAPGLKSSDFSKLLPDFISHRLKEGFKTFGRKSKGFLTNDAILVGLESRTSSPIRILRDKDNLESVSIKRIYPAGEGAGYAGGIVSAAIDGMRAVSALNNKIKNDNT